MRTMGVLLALVGSIILYFAATGADVKAITKGVADSAG